MASSQKARLGVYEIFFGPQWPMESRFRLAQFLGQHGFDFYTYAPKQDSHLRKSWREAWPQSYIQSLRNLAEAFHKQNVKFGVAISPFGFDANSSNDLQTFKDKLKTLKDIGIQSLGLFFDDMHYEEKALKAQILTAETARSITNSEIHFCPSYYSYDPILDKVFGQRPANYLQEIGNNIPQGIEILWTGPKVISPEIPPEHIDEVSQILKRRPFLCDNVFANDGPKQCKYVKIKPLLGRPKETFEKTSGWCFNPMNQPALSQVVVLSAKLVMQNGLDPEKALAQALSETGSRALVEFIQENREGFMKENLDQIDHSRKSILIEKLQTFKGELIAQDLIAWLQGKYTVGSECLTD